MGKCKYCGQKAGFLSNVHRECEQKHDEGQTQITQKLLDFIIIGGDSNSLENEINQIASSDFINKDSLGKLFATAFDTAIKKLTTDSVISVDAENKIKVFFKYYGKFFGEASFASDSTYEMTKSVTLREIMNGNIPNTVNELKQSLPFNFLKNEILIWAEKGVDYCEQKTYTHYQGGSSGISMRIAKGLYYRTSAFKGYPVKSTSWVSYGLGTLAITDKNIYFSSQAKTFRIKIDKVIAFHPYSDAVGFEKDGASTKPQFFKELDGSFYYNLLTNLANLNSNV